MNFKKYIMQHPDALNGRTAALTGATGGIGVHICRYILSLGGNLIILGRNTEKLKSLKNELLKEYKKASIKIIRLDLEDLASADAAIEELKAENPDYLIHNAGVYNVPRETGRYGYDRIFMTNFVTPYYITKKILPQIKEKGGKTVAMGSIAHNYSHIDCEDIGFRTRKGCALAYGNSKRFLMFAMSELMRNEKAAFAIAHPGITVTNMTDHYPRWLYKIIKNPMKLIFMKPQKAALSVIAALFTDVPYGCWTGPRVFNIWGQPSVKKIGTADIAERRRIYEEAERIYEKLK